MTTPHKHSFFIKAWADGKPIQWWEDSCGTWIPDKNPTWDLELQYRISPKQEIYKTAIMADDSGDPYIQSRRYNPSHFRSETIEELSSFISWGPVVEVTLYEGESGPWAEWKVYE